MNKSDFETKANKVAGAIAGIFIFYGVIVALFALYAFSEGLASYGIGYLAVAFFVSLMGIFYKYVLNGIVHTMDQNKYIIQRQNEIEALVRRNQGNGYSNFGQSNNGYQNNGYSNFGQSDNGYQNNGYSNNGF